MKFTDEQAILVRDTVELIKLSPGFANSPQLQNFLSFIVEKTLADKAAEIKGYTIGVDALGRSEDFDPSTDPSVRVMAGRLRQALVNYFRESVSSQPVTINLEKGSYVPVITFQKQSDIETDGEQPVGLTKHGDENLQRKSGWRLTATVALLITVCAAVIFLTDLGFDRFRKKQSYTGSVILPKPAGISTDHTRLPTITIQTDFNQGKIPDWISSEELKLRVFIAFSRFREYRIYNVTDENEKTNTEYFTADYALSILFTKSDNRNDLEAFLKLEQPLTGKIVWSADFVFPKPVGSQEQSNRELIEQTVTELMSPYGVIYRDIAGAQTAESRFQCKATIYSYFMNESRQAFADGFECAHNLTASGKASSSMHALLAFMYVEAFRRDYRTERPDPLKAAEEHADRAIQLDPANARAYQARFAVEKTKGTSDRNNLIATAKKAIALNPIDRDILGDIAAFFIATDEPEVAEPYLEKAVSLTPAPPGWLNFYNYLFADLTGNFTSADNIADKLDPEQSSLVALAVLLAAERRGHRKQMQDTALILGKLEPALLNETEVTLKRRGFASDLAKKLADRVARTRPD